MIFTILIFAALTGSAIVANMINPWWATFLCFFPICSFFLLIAWLLAVALSLWLGRKSKFGLYKTQRFAVKYMDAERIICTKTGETLKISDIPEIVSSDKICTPTLFVRRYNLTGWRAKWLLTMHPDRIEYSLYTPPQDEV